MKLTFEHDTHTYRLNGQVVPSVTQALDFVNFVDTYWFTEVCRKRGDMVHLGIHAYETGHLHKPGHTDLKVFQPYLDSWQKLKERMGITVIASEFRMGSDQYRFAGTMDIVALLGDSIAIIDNKSGIVRPCAAIQTALYDVLLDEPDPDLTRQQLGNKADEFIKALTRPHWRFGVELHDDGSMGKLFPFTEYTDRGVGLAAVTCWHWRDKHGV